ncbi:hypothetical protein NL676_001370 [Syzygium grande]|nr:hypothetical protein NL676_001370 [Syzygium grande]
MMIPSSDIPATYPIEGARNAIRVTDGPHLTIRTLASGPTLMSLPLPLTKFPRTERCRRGFASQCAQVFTAFNGGNVRLQWLTRKWRFTLKMTLELVLQLVGKNSWGQSSRVVPLQGSSTLTENVKTELVLSSATTQELRANEADDFVLSPKDRKSNVAHENNMEDHIKRWFEFEHEHERHGLSSMVRPGEQSLDSHVKICPRFASSGERAAATGRAPEHAWPRAEFSFPTMYGLSRRFLALGRGLHTVSSDGPSDTLRRKIAELEKMKKKRNPRKNQVFVEVPEPKTFLDTATWPMILASVGIALFAKLLMMYDDSRSQEIIERKIKHAPAGQGSVRMLSREEWDEIREVRPRTPFESKLARPNARIRTGEPLRMEDLKDWTIDVIADALARVEESVHNPK